MSGRDWDDEDPAEPRVRGKVRSRATKKDKPRTIQARFLEMSETDAVVTEVHPKLCRVRLDSGGGDLLCSYRRVDVLHRSIGIYRERSPVAVGDRVKVTVLGSRDGVIEGVASRKNALWRMAPGERESVLHVVGANLDGVALIASAREPDFIPGVVDRYLIACRRESIPVLLVINKIDLIEGEASPRPWSLYRDLGLADVEETSVRDGIGIEAVRGRLASGTWLFCGHSGVGKTSLLRALLGSEVGAIGGVNEVTGKGRHTTTSSSVYERPGGGARWIDTPGVREFAVSGLDPGSLASYFPEFEGLSCAVEGCAHAGEEGCSAAGLPRHSSYLRILEEISASAPAERGSGPGPSRPGS